MKEQQQQSVKDKRQAHRESRCDTKTSQLVAVDADFAREIRREISRVTPLQFGALPVFASESFAAIGRATFAFNGVIIVVSRRPVVREFFTGADVAHRHERNLTTHSEIRIARVIRI